MHITVEISLYPLQEDYKTAIKDFIKTMKTESDIIIKTTAMSTYLSGPYDIVMACLTTHLQPVFEVLPHSATVIKIIPQNLQVEQGFIEIV